MSEVDDLIEKMRKETVLGEQFSKDMGNSLRVVLEAIERGEIVDCDCSFEIFLKKPFKEFLEKTK